MARPTRTRKAARRRLQAEALEPREVPAGGLTAQVGAGGVTLNPGANSILFAGQTTADQQALAAFFTSANGQAAPVTLAGTLTAGGQAVTGSFALAEFGPTTGVSVLAADASVQLGGAAGIRLSGADGAFALLPTGAAGRLTAEDFSDGAGVDVAGVPGLRLDSTADGLTFRLNTTGQAISKAVTGPNGAVQITFPDAAPVKRIDGAADFRVTGPSGTVLRAGGTFAATETAKGLSLAGTQVGVDLYAGSVRAVTLGAAAAKFALTADGLALDGAFPVGGFFPLPPGQPIPAGQGNYPATPLAFDVPLGPLQLKAVSPVLSDLRFGPGGLAVGLGLTAASASLEFAAASARADGLTGTFTLAGPVSPTTGAVTKFTASGAFALTADSFALDVPKVLTASATKLAIGYDPQAVGGQQLLSAATATVSVPALHLTGEFSPTDSLPGLVVRTDGFAFGDGKLTLTKTIALTNAVSITNPFIRLGDFKYSKTTGVSVGAFAVGAAEVAVSGGKVSATGTDVQAAVTFTPAGAVNSFTFSAGSLEAKFGSLVRVTGTAVAFTPTATGADPILAAGTAQAEVTIGSTGLVLTGGAGNIALGADGSVTGPDTLFVRADFGPNAAGKFLWPSVLPFQLKSVSLEWPEFRADPGHFVIGLSASFDTKLGPIALSGGVDRLTIDPYRLAAGQFPVTQIDGFAVSAGGKLFGGEVTASLVAGIVKLDAEGNVLDSGASVFASTVFYGAIEGQFHFGNIGAGIRLGFSQNGLLQAYLSAEVPILLDPSSGLQLSGFRGGVTFNAPPLTAPASPTDLLAPAFKPTLSLTAEEWRAQLEEQVANLAQGGSRIFVIADGVPGVLSVLGTGSVQVGDALETVFADEGYAVADAAVPGAVTVLVPGAQWLVTYKGTPYILQLADNKIEVTKAQFVTPDGSLATALAAGPVSAAVRAAFAANNISLAPTATVSVLTAGAKWKIADGGATYFATVRGNRVAVTGGGAGFGALDTVTRIEAGATLSNQYLSENVFKADVDVIITTDGQFVILGKLTVADTISADVRLYGDLRGVINPTPDHPVRLVFLADLPAPDAAQGVPNVVRLQGELTIEFLDAAGNLINPIYARPTSYRFTVLGRGEVKVLDYAKLVFGGDAGANGGFARLQLTVQDAPGRTRVELDVSGSLSIAGVLPASDLVSAAGRLIFDKRSGAPLEITGAVRLSFDAGSPGLSMLKDAGLSAAQADLLLAFNSTSQTKELTLQLPGRAADTLLLAPATLALEGTGTLRFAAGVTQFGADIAFDGAFAARISVDTNPPLPGNPDPTVRGDGGIDLDLFVAAKLDAGLSVAGQRFNLLTLDGVGFVAVRDICGRVNGNLLTPVIAGRVDLVIQRDLPGVFKAEGSVQLLLNSTDRAFTYVIPDRLQDRLKDIQGRRTHTPPGQVTLPPLPAVDGKLVVVVPDRPPALLSGEQFKAGPYFMLQFGDLDESVAPGGKSDPDGDGLVDVSVTLLDSFKLSGDFRVLAGAGGFELAANAGVQLAVPGAEGLLSGAATGLLRVTDAGLVGALGVQSKLAIPGVDLKASTLAYLGVNTTGKAETLNFQLPSLVNPVLAPRSGVVYVDGKLTAGGFEIGGLFSLTASSKAVEIQVDAGLKLFDLGGIRVSGKAGVYYGLAPSQNGFALDARLSVGAGGTFGVPGLFTVGGDLRLRIDSRPASPLFAVDVDNVKVNLLSVIEFGGSAHIFAGTDMATGESYFRLDGSLSGNLFDVISVSASGFLDSRGYFGLSLAGDLRLGTDAFGIQAGGTLFIEKSETVPLDFGASLYGRIRAFGLTLAGVRAAVDYDGYGPGEGATGKIGVHAAIETIFGDIPVDFTVGYLTLSPSAAPVLGSQTGNTVLLNVGPRSSFRALNPAETREAYTVESLGAGTLVGEKVRVRAFGSTQVFDNVTRLEGDFGDGADQLLLRPNLGSFRPVAVVVSGGAGNDLLVNQSKATATLTGGAGDDVLLSQGTADLLDGEADNDTLSGGATATLRGGAGDDRLGWQTDLGRPAELTGGAGADTLAVTGTDAAEAFALDGSAAGLTVAVGGATALATGVETVELTGRGGADTLAVALGGLTAAVVMAVTADLSLAQGPATQGTGGSTTLALRDDGSADAVTLTGTAAAEAFAVAAAGSDVRVTVGSFTLTLKSPGRATDTLTVRAGDGADTLTVAGPNTPAANLVRVALFGEGGDDAFRLPVGGADFDGGAGANTATFTVSAGDDTAVSLTQDRVSTARGASAYAGLAEVGVEAAVPATVGVQSTHAGRTRVALAAGGSVAVAGTGGPLTLALGTGTATLAAAGGPVTVAGGSAVQVGTGLLSKLGSVALADVAAVTFDDSQDGPNRTYALSAAGLTVAGLPLAATLTNAKSVELRAGLGDDTVAVTVGPAALTVDGGRGADTVAATQAGAPAAGYDPTRPLVRATSTVEAVRFDNSGNAAGTNWVLRSGDLSGGGVRLLESQAAPEVRLGAGADTVQVVGTVRTTLLDVGGGANAVTVGDGTLDSLTAGLTLAAAAAGNTLTLNDSASSPGFSRPLTLAGGTVQTASPGGKVAFDPARFGSLTANLGAANDVVTLRDLPANTFVSGGAGNDTFAASGAVGSLGIRGGDGADALTVGSGTGLVAYNGDGSPAGQPDTATVDRSTAVTPQTAGVTAAGALALLAVSGAPTLQVAAAADVKSLTILLGGGNDTVSVDTRNAAGSNFSPQSLRVAGGGGTTRSPSPARPGRPTR